MFNQSDEDQQFEFMVAEFNRVAVISLMGDLKSKHQARFESFLNVLKERPEEYYVIQCREVTGVDQMGLQLLARIYATIKNVKKAKFFFCSVHPEIKNRLIQMEAVPKEKIMDNLRVAINKIILE